MGTIDDPLCIERNGVAYNKIVGMLLWVSNQTRSDTAYTVHLLSSMLKHPTAKAWLAVVDLSRHLHGTRTLGLKYVRTNDINMNLTTYSDASYNKFGTDKTLPPRSTSGIVIYLAGSPIMWKSIWQPFFADSSSYAEYVGLSLAANMTKIARSNLQELGFPMNSPTIIYGDNVSAIHFVEGKQSSALRHIDIKLHNIRFYARSNQILVKYIKTENMIADALTKALSVQPFSRHQKALVFDTNINNIKNGVSVI
jgi:hypothetical protein